MSQPSFDHKPILSIIMPVYNAAATLTRAVVSVVRQPGAPRRELILVDDGSTDGSDELCDALAEKQSCSDCAVRVVHRKNGGASAARNTGLAAARGGYIAFLDSDDAWLPGAGASLWAAHLAHPDSWLLWRYSVGSPEKDAAFWGAEGFSGAARSFGTNSLAALYNGCVLAMPWNKLYRADLARSVAFDPAYPLGEDLLFCLDYLRAAGPDTEICLLEQALCLYDTSRTDGTLSTQYLPDYCPLWERLFSRLWADCTDYDCPAEDLHRLQRAWLQIIAEGAADILDRSSLPRAAREKQARAALHAQELRSLLAGMAQEHCYSPYYLPVRGGQLWLVRRLARARRQGERLYGRCDWLGWYLLGGRWSRS